MITGRTLPRGRRRVASFVTGLAFQRRALPAFVRGFPAYPLAYLSHSLTGDIVLNGILNRLYPGGGASFSWGVPSSSSITALSIAMAN